MLTQPFARGLALIMFYAAGWMSALAWLFPIAQTWWFVHESTPVAPEFAEALGLQIGGGFGFTGKFI